jgi:hypothetical protein
MALITIVVTGKKEGFNDRGNNVASETQGIETSQIRYFVPAVCRNHRDELDSTKITTNAKIYMASADPKNSLVLWTTSTVTAIATLT